MSYLFVMLAHPIGCVGSQGVFQQLEKHTGLRDLDFMSAWDVQEILFCQVRMHNTNSDCHGFTVGNNQSTQGRGPRARVVCDHIIPCGIFISYLIGQCGY